MYFHEPSATAYLVPPRTASRATAEVLQIAGFERVESHHEICKETLDKADRVYCTVRNPFDCLASWWTSGQPRGGRWAKRGMSFEEYVIAFKANRVHLFKRWTDHATDLVRYETLDRDLSEVVGCDVVAPRVTDRGSHRGGRHYSEYYTPRLRLFVDTEFGDELESLGYSYEVNHAIC